MNNKTLEYYLALIGGGIVTSAVINLIIPGAYTEQTLVENMSIYFVSGMFSVMWLK